MSETLRTIDKMFDSVVEDPATFEKLYHSHPELQTHSPWLYHAARNGVVVVVDFLLEKGHSPNEESGGTVSQNALTAACSEGSVECVDRLIRAGATADVTSLENNPLLSAITARSLRCAQLLVEAGIDLHKVYVLPDGRQRNALEFAQRWGCSDIVEYLFALGAVLPD